MLRNSSSSRSAHRPIRALAAVAALAIVFAGLSGGAAFADDVDGIAGAPSDGTSSDQRSDFDYRLSPGQQVTDYYIAKNTGSTPQTLKIFATDAFNAADGGYALLDTDKQPTGVGSWITFDDGSKKILATLAPGASKVVTFIVTVPADATPGDHPGGIVISVQSGSGQVLVDKRVATRLYVRVPGELQPILTISSVTASYEPQLNPFDGATTVTASIKNGGNVALGAKTLVGVNALFGIPLGTPVREEIPELLPGGSTTISFKVSGIGQWLYLNPYVHLVPTVTAVAQNPGVLKEVDRDTVLFVVPWWLIAILVVALIIVVFARIRNRRDAKAATAWIEYTNEEARRKAAEEKELAPATAVSGSDTSDA